MATLVSRVTDNWKLKLLAFLLAVLLWIVVSAEQVQVKWIRADVSLQVDEDDYEVVSGPIPQSVEVRVSGRWRELLELAWDEPRLVVPLEGVEPGRQSVPIGPSMVRIPTDLAVRAVDVRPRTIQINAASVTSREIPVSVRIGRRPERGFALVDSVRVEPRTVRVTGPTRRLRALGAVPTRAVDLADVDSAFSREVALDTAALAGLRMDRRGVTVSGTVDRIISRTLSSVPVSAPPGLVVTPRLVDVAISGAERTVREVTPADLTVEVRADSLVAPIPPTGAVAPLRVRVAQPGVDAGVRPPSVRVFESVADSVVVADTVPGGAPADESP